MFGEKFIPDIIEDDVEFLPLLSEDDENEMNKQEVPDLLAILPIRNTVLFPGVIIPITVARDKSIKLIKDAYKKEKIIGVIAQKNADVEDPEIDDLYDVGTVAKIIRMLRMPDGSTTVIIQGRRRFQITEVVSDDPYIKATVKLKREVKPKQDKQAVAMISTIKDMATNIIQLSPNIPSEASIALKNIGSATFLINFISSNLNVEVSVKEKILEADGFNDRANIVMKHLNEELQMLEIKKEIQSKVDSDIQKQQRQFLLHQQLKTIQEELGSDGGDFELEQLKKRAAKKKWGKEVNETFHKEVEKLYRMNQSMPEYSVTLNYLELLLDLPWKEYTKDDFDLNKAQKILDRDHYGLEKVKKRILEYLAVLKLKKDMKSPILCLVGPPGVGKTSLGKSIAKALKRKFVRMSLGGLHDESEIRGHRKTYIGAMPGRIVQSIKKSKSSNPVFILDEIDKVGTDFRGDPSSALLEVLDPEQNSTFYDNYLELEYDLSKVMFVATANTLSTIQPALRDRMEIIEVNGYTVEEKIQIAQKYLIPRLRKDHGLKAGNITLRANVIQKIAEDYTRESGVRGLDKTLAAVMRHIAKKVAGEEVYNPSIKVSDVKGILGPARFDKEVYKDVKVPGVAVGLAWTPVGGDILFIEVGLSPGKGQLIMTGNLGDVMKESATTALSYIKSNALRLGINAEIFKYWDLHVHVPEGAIPKDGPSAGITMLTAMVSAFRQQLVKPYMAMTGEITLRGKVLPVGGIKEKILAAIRAGINNIILCKANKKDIEEIKSEYMKGINISYVEYMHEVLEFAITNRKVRKPVDLEAIIPKNKSEESVLS